MNPSQPDADVERLVERSLLFRTVRARLLTLDAAVASSASARIIPRRLTRRSTGAMLMAAGLSNGLVEAFAPVATAPAGRYLFAVSSAAIGAWLFRSRRD
jgi:hypothetical protein